MTSFSRSSNVSKSFGAIHALRGVDFELRRGEVHAIAGENGAGKSTLMNIIDGILRPDSGEILLNGKLGARSPLRPARRSSASASCTRRSHSAPMCRWPRTSSWRKSTPARNWFMDYRDLDAGRARRCRTARAPSIRRVLVETLSASPASSWWRSPRRSTLDCRILILDEPTAALTEREARVLFGIMRQLAARGISIIYISHRLVEIFENCDRVSMFRDGRQRRDRQTWPR